MKKSLAIILLLFAAYSYAQTVVINEFMAKNSTTIQDKDGDYSDWIELYNPTNLPINLQNYSLSDDNDTPNKWIFPQISIFPYGYLVVFASGKDILTLPELHTNFKLSSSGEELLLSNAEGILIDQTDAVSLTADQSYGRVPDGDPNWIVINTPTPGSSNNYSNQLLFSNPEGFYTEPFSLTVTSLLENSIYYTLDGSIPTENSAVYSSALFIEDRNSDPNVLSEIPTTPDQSLIVYKAWESPSVVLEKATILRCASYNNGNRTSKVYTKTYFVDDEIEGKYTLPVISLVTDKESLFDYDTGLFVPGVHYDPAQPFETGNYFMRGDTWERAIHIEYFDTDGNLGFSQDAGVRIHGASSRQAAQKTLRLYSREEYGKDYFNYKLFPQKEVEKYKRFLLRATMSDCCGQIIIKDDVAQNTVSALDIDSQDSNPVLVFINGEYWGIHTLKDRIDERYIEYTHNIDKDSVEFMLWGSPTHIELLDFIENNSLENSANYAYIQTQIDIDSYIDYVIAQLFLCNYDWPGNNIKMWRKTDGGKWRWIFYDLDFGFKNQTYSMLEHAVLNDTTITWPNPPSSTFMFRNFLKNELFTSTLLDRYAEILKTGFRPQHMKTKLDSIQELYSPEIVDHIGRWHYPDSYATWEGDIFYKLEDFIDARPCIVKDNIMDFFELTSFDFDCTMNIAQNDQDENFILAPNPCSGQFFLYNNYLDIKNATITVANINGQIVYRKHHTDILKNERSYFDLSHLPNNTYILQIVSNNYAEQKKVIIMK